MILLVMGVTGSGKTTARKLLARKLAWLFLDADDFHPPQNIEKMKHGVSLPDQDREPWLAALHAALLKCAAKNQDAVLACSARKQSYRETLASGVVLRICHLQGTYSEIETCLENRSGHFAGGAILAEQYSDLEEPRDALSLRASDTPEEVVQDALRKLNLN